MQDDPGRVNAVDPVEVKSWCRELNCTEDELAEAVAKVGAHVAEVREFLDSPDCPQRQRLPTPIPTCPMKKGPSDRSLRPCFTWLLDLGSNQGPTD